MGGVANSRVVIQALQHLATHGWITLRAMSPLLGYAHPTGIYQRQKGRNLIPTVKIGGRYRVYAHDVIQTLQDVPKQDQEGAEHILSIYRAMLRRKEQDNAAGEE